MLRNQGKLFFLSAITAGLSALSVKPLLANNANPMAVCGFSANVSFRESAPKDRFTITNSSTSDWKMNSLTLDLSTSAGNLIFDVTADGAGVEVFQPFRTEQGSAELREQPTVEDGDQIITLLFTNFGRDAEYQFSIDVDDQLSNSALGQIRVAGSEIEGAVLTLAIRNPAGESAMVSGIFNNQNQIRFAGDEC